MTLDEQIPMSPRISSASAVSSISSIAVIELACFTLIAEAQIPLKPSHDIWSLINEFKGDPTMTISLSHAAIFGVLPSQI